MYQYVAIRGCISWTEENLYHVLCCMFRAHAKNTHKKSLGFLWVFYLLLNYSASPSVESETGAGSSALS